MSWHRYKNIDDRFVNLIGKTLYSRVRKDDEYYAEEFVVATFNNGIFMSEEGKSYCVEDCFKQIYRTNDFTVFLMLIELPHTPFYIACNKDRKLFFSFAMSKKNNLENVISETKERLGSLDF